MFSIGIDFGSSAVRVLVLDTASGKDIQSVSVDYNPEIQGVYCDKSDDNVARQDAQDYLNALKKAFTIIHHKKEMKTFDWSKVIGIGIDATGSTPIPITKSLKPLSDLKKFKNNLNAKAWMWKDHSSEKEAKKITKLAHEIRPEFLKTCGGSYSSEWFWAKLLHCVDIDEEVFKTSYTWVEFSDYIPAVLAGKTDADYIKRNSCAAGHKAFYNKSWGGYPDSDFLNKLHPELVRIRKTLLQKAKNIENLAGHLSNEWAKEFGIPKGIPIAMGVLDAHAGAIGSGVNDKTLVKIIGTSTCDIIVGDENINYIPGVSGIADDSVLPGYMGIESGQSAVGDLFKWFVIELLGKEESYHKVLVEKGFKTKAGESGLLALDWNNGNRNILSDTNLRGLIVGQSLYTKDFEIYRALIEATAFGAKSIIDRLESCGVEIEKLVCCGGIPQKNPLFMQIYANVLNRPVEVSQNTETVALGAAMAGALAGLKSNHKDITIEELQNRCCEQNSLKYTPEESEVNTYKKLYELYMNLHDAFGKKESKNNMFDVMKTLIHIKQSI